jgi:hypothetical protein
MAGPGSTRPLFLGVELLRATTKGARTTATNVGDLLDSEPSVDLIHNIAKVALDLFYAGLQCPAYFHGLEQALRDEPPPFGTAEYGMIYRSLSVEPRWMAVSLITNAEREGDGAKRLWSLAACSPVAKHQRLLKRHACDESRHALLYLTLLDLSFPGIVSPEFRAELRQLSPGFAMHQILSPVPGSPYAKAPTVDDFLQMNIAEIRTAIHHLLQRPALSLHCPPASQPNIRRINDSLLRDELRHIAYTAILIQECAQKGDEAILSDLFRTRFRHFNAITTEELGNNVYDCSVACCAKRPSCRAKASDPMPEQALYQIGVNSH